MPPSVEPLNQSDRQPNMFERPKQNRIYQDVVDQVQRAVLSGRLREGDTLPPERELQEMFGVSRGTLREAIRVLEQKGILEVRPGTGGGAVVRRASTDTVSESLAFLIRSRQVSLDDLAEFRADVEGIVTGAAAERADSEDIALLRRLLAEAQHHFRQGLPAWNEFIRIDEKMHMALAEAAKNPIYRLILRIVHDNVHGYYDRFLPGGKQEMAENFRDLSDIVSAVASGDAAAARAAARDHVRRFTRHMQKRKKQIVSRNPKDRSRQNGK
jgi:DNA-binding FadR family transcriptional regulator